MGFAIQVGLLAAFVVVFLPLIMAGLHLTRNRLLFFSVALFITLAVSVHLAPYIPSTYFMLSSSNGLQENVDKVLAGQSACSSYLHEMTWEPENAAVNEEYVASDQSLSKSCILRYIWSWNENVSGICGFQILNRTDALQFLNGSWIMVAGDSQARLFLLALMEHLLLSTEFNRDELFKRHSDYTFEGHQIKFDFVWAPYISNLTSMVTDLRRHHIYPDVLIMGDGLWHMLHITNASDQLHALTDLQKAVYSLFPSSSYFSFLSSRNERVTSRVPVMFWINVPYIVTSILNTEEKRQKLTQGLYAEYDYKLHISKILKPEGPLTLLDLHRLSKDCGTECTIDGMHYCNVIYEAAVQIMLNELLIATQQAPPR